MAIEVVTRTGWFGRIGDALKGLMFGIILVIAALVLQVMNERNAVRDIAANKEIAAAMVTVDSREVDPAHEGKLVHVSGKAVTDEIVRNEMFGIEENAIRLSWDAKIYQWVEKKTTKTEKNAGGSEETVTTYSYEKKWVDEPVDSSGFREPGHVNSGSRKFHSGMSEAKKVTLGAFVLPERLVAGIDVSARYAPKSLPPAMAEAGRIVDGVFHTGDAANPRIGDERIEFTIVRPSDVTVLAVQRGDSFAPYVAQNGKERFIIEEGVLSADKVVEAQEQKAMFLRWALRAGGVFLMFIGFTLFLRPLSVLADVIPLFGSLVGKALGLVSLLLSIGISAIVIALSWLAFRPMIGIPLLVVGVASLVLVVRALLKRSGTPRGAAA